MKILYKVAALSRKAISKAEKFTLRGSLTDITGKHLLKELYSFLVSIDGLSRDQIQCYPMTRRPAK